MFQNPLMPGGGPVIGSTAFTVVTSELERPELDNRSYKVIKLHNDLEALLIHDPDTDKSSAALDVRVGAFSDPKDLQGLAHFCEHLLFMGTEKYPKENDYSEYLSSHSGHSNAYTDSCDTNYFFEVGHEHLEGALDRFAQFFIAPLFSPDCKDREIRAVDSENKKNLQSDLWRLHQLDKSLANPDYAYSNFSTGNIETLETIPVSQGIDVRDELLKFHNKYYSANVMKLVILGREPLEQLEQWTVEKFSAVSNSKVSPPKFEGTPYTEKELQKAIFAKPVMDERRLEISFLFPDQRPLYRSHPGQYYSHLIGHEGPGSILHYLKSKSWANGLSAGPSHVTDGAEFFEISVDLASEGLKNYENVMVTVFQYLKLLKQTEPQEWIYNELRDVAASNFRFRQKTPASSTTSRLAAVMQQDLPREWLLSGIALYREFDKDEISRSANYFNPGAFRYTLVSQDYPGDWDKKEKWYGTEYKIEDIKSKLLEDIKSAPLNSELYLPEKNEFIATNFDVDKKEVDSPTKSPALITDIPGLRVWFKNDDTFWVPKANIHISIRNPVTSISPGSTVKTRMLVELIVDSLNAYAYAANIAGLNYYIGMTSDGIAIGIDGYNHKMVVLLKKILEKISDFKVETERFNVIKEEVKREYKNFDFSIPYHQIGFYTSYLMSEKSFLNEEKLVELDALQPEDVQLFIPHLTKQFDTEILVHGNLVKDDAHTVVKLVDSILKHRPLPSSMEIRQRSLVLPPATKLAYKRQNGDAKNVNSCIEYYCQVGELTNRRQRVTLALLAQIGNEPAFNQLRTKEQLGYVVFSGVRQTRTYMGYRVLIQSEKTTEYLETRIDAFFNKFATLIKEMPEEEYQKHVKSLIIKRKEKLKNLNEETNRYWGNIQSGYYDYFKNIVEVEILPTITKDEVLELFNRYVHPSSASRSKLVVQLQSQCAPPLPTLTRLLETGFAEFWKLNSLPADQIASHTAIAQMAESADPLASFKEFFLKASLGEVWETNGKDFVAEQIKLTTPPVEEEGTELVDDVVKFKSLSSISVAPMPVQDLTMFKELDSKL
ncbi:Metalloenzyme, LuxS/M16 peptidase-like protein [Lipomyces arxii]|uniref:Metalloenzyme, LuxS/M16 peptidase-like protein n=1 Tax=Lipomyces arxii TaxID=56418 RepID=UPI0034CD7EF7